MQVGTVRAITRFPVKSMAGEDLDQVELNHRGLVGDRVLALRTADGGLGSGKTSRRFRRLPGLRLVRARTGDDGVVRLHLPDGRVLVALEADGALSELVGQPVSVVAEGAVSHFDEDGLHLVTTASLSVVTDASGLAVDPRRTRANFLLETTDDGFVEDGWQGRELVVGGAVVRVGAPMPRCVMVNQAGADLPEAPGLLRALGQVHGADLGMVAAVARPGTVAVGDAVVLRR